MTAIVQQQNAIQHRIHENIPPAIQQKLSPSELAIVNASVVTKSNKRVCEYSEPHRLRMATAIVVKAKTRLGSKESDAAHQEALIAEIDSDLCKFPNLTQLEVFASLERGLDGEYTESKIVIFTPSNFVIWIKAYIEQQKKPAMKKLAQFQQQQTEPERELTPAEEIDSALSVLRLAIERRLAGNDFEDFGGVVYRLLDDFEYLNLTAEAKWDYIRKANQAMIAEAMEAKDTKRIKSLSDVMATVRAGERNEAVIAKAQRIIVSEKLDQICETPDDAADFIENLAGKIAEFVESLDD